MKYGLPMVASLVLAACTSSSPVYIQSHLARLDLPEPPSRTVRLSTGFYDKNTYVVLTREQSVTAPSANPTVATETAPDGAQGNDDLFWGRFDLNLGKRLTIGASAPTSGGPTLFRAKLYLTGTPRERARKGTFSAAVTAGYGRDHHGFDSSTGEHTQVVRRQQDYALILGARILRTVLLYGGPYLQRSSFKFDFQKPGNPDSHGEGDISTVGGHVGLAFHAGRFSSFLLEFSRARVDAPGDRATLDTSAATYQLDF